MNSIEKFLDFNGRKVYFLAANGQWLIAIKPLCEALGVDYISQFKALKADPLLGQQWSLETMVVPGRGNGMKKGSALSAETTQTPLQFQRRKMVCLPEQFIYGWLFSLQSDSAALQEYRGKCYQLLYNYFHGSITDRNKYLKERTTSRAEAAQLRKVLSADANYIRLQELQGRALSAEKALKQLDHDLVASQLPLWSNDNIN